MSAPAPSLDLHRRVRAAFVLQGTSMKAWCTKNKIHPSNVRNALIGSWNGPAGQAMRQRVVQASGLKEMA